jgi:FAD-dependent urate hydroxylase
MTHETQLLIVGAGPYGLASAAYAQHLGLDTLVVGGSPMGFWRDHMPRGMFLRTPIGWHLDPFEEHTLSAYLKHIGLSEKQATPIPVETYLGYADWFLDSRRLPVQPSMVTALWHADDRFRVTLDNGEDIHAEQVLIAPGFTHFAHVPADVLAKLPAGHYSHTMQLAHFDSLHGRRVLIIGGRQSAFEWAALIAEHGAEEVHVAYRHDTPRFEEADLSPIESMIRATGENRGWFRRLPPAERDDIRQRMYALTRLQLEPWLAPPNVCLWPKASLADSTMLADGTIRARLVTGSELDVDHVILATGYKVDVSRVPYLRAGNLLPDLRIEDGFPLLDEDFESSVPGLFFTGIVAMRDFGPLFASIAVCRAAAQIIGRRVALNVSTMKV